MDEKDLAIYFPASYKDIDILEHENLIHGGFEKWKKIDLNLLFGQLNLWRFSRKYRFSYYNAVKLYQENFRFFYN